jgi:hypothetical protein
MAKPKKKKIKQKKKQSEKNLHTWNSLGTPKWLKSWTQNVKPDNIS